jgi:hypothetical protein
MRGGEERRGEERRGEEKRRKKEIAKRSKSHRFVIIINQYLTVLQLALKVLRSLVGTNFPNLHTMIASCLVLGGGKAEKVQERSVKSRGRREMGEERRSLIFCFF